MKKQFQVMPRLDNYIVQEVLKKRREQDFKWGRVSKNDYEWASILSDQIRGLAGAFFDKDLAQAKEEAIRVAATAVAIAGAIDFEEGRVKKFPVD